MGSCSTDLKVGIGGLEGRLLKDGDRLPIGKAKRDFMEAQGVKQLLWGNRIRALQAGISWSMVPRRMHSGVRPGSFTRKVTAWAIAYRGKF